ncbi:MAG: 16S rRNA (cytosine(1402)-N(4))-methyltransferase, partial [Nitrospirae bacterium]
MTERGGIAVMHRPVMLQEVLAWLQPRAGGIYLDGTIGAGGHSLAILEASGADGRIVGLDRDATAVATVRQALRLYGDRAVIVQAAYDDAPHVVRETT